MASLLQYSGDDELVQDLFKFMVEIIYKQHDHMISNPNPRTKKKLLYTVDCICRDKIRYKSDSGQVLYLCGF
jgi:hypothetical protein